MNARAPPNVVEADPRVGRRRHDRRVSGTGLADVVAIRRGHGRLDRKTLVDPVDRVVGR